MVIINFGVENFATFAGNKIPQCFVFKILLLKIFENLLLKFFENLLLKIFDNSWTWKIFTILGLRVFSKCYIASTFEHKCWNFFGCWNKIKFVTCHNLQNPLHSFHSLQCSKFCCWKFLTLRKFSPSWDLVNFHNAI